MKIDIWADVVCPWCYIGKRRLESALTEFRHGDDVEVVWHSFELDPTAPAVGTETVPEMLGRRYGGGEEAGRRMIAQVDEVAAGEGLAFDQSKALHASSHDAHRLLHLARAEGAPGTQDVLKERLMSAYFVEGRDIADADVLAEMAVAAGLDAARVDEVLAGEEFDDAVADDIARAGEYGATGVPFFVIDGRYGISGAHPTDVLVSAIERAWDERSTASLA